MRWSVVVPVKALDAAKSRLPLDGAAGREDLALAFVTDCLSALTAARSIDRVLVVSSDVSIRAVAAKLGATWLDEPVPAGLNAAAAHGLSALQGPAAVVVGDLPALTPQAVDLALGLGAEVERGIISDTGGTGTTILLGCDPAHCAPMFGPRSRARHVAAGCIDLGMDLTTPELARARRDVDTEVDLADALRLGVGAATRAALRLP